MHSTGTEHRRAARVLLVTAVLVLAALLSSGQQASAVQQKRGRDAKPTVVLVHGAWADSSSWDSVVGRLQHRGFTVDVVPNPLRGLASDAAYLASFLRTVPGPIVLAGHSYGGAVITNAALGNSAVKALVFVDAFVPDEGESVAQLAGERPGSALAVSDPTTVFSLVPYAGAAEGDYDLYVLPQVFRTAFANDLSSRRAAVLASTQRPVTLSAISAPSGTPAWKTIPSWYLVGTLDKVLPPAEQSAMASRAHSHVLRVRAGHLSMITRPGAVVRLVRDATHTTAARR